MKRLSLILTLVLLGSVFAIAQKTVTGTITDDKGSGLPGASVAVKGTTVGTVTDLDGKFSLSVPDGSTTLVVSSIGLETKELNIKNTSDVALKMFTDTKALSEIVVTGTGVGTNKKKLGIAVEAISTSQLPQGISSSVDQALVGLVPGAQISTVSGIPGAPVNIVLRGINTLNRGTTPMFLLDGVQIVATDLAAIDLYAIERIEIVQGAASAGIYGAQGANGVVQLFSKKGRAGEVKVDIYSSIATSSYLNIGGVAKANLHAFATDAANNVVDGNGKPITQDPITGRLSGNLTWNSLDPTNTTSKPYNANFKYYDHFAEFFVPATTYNAGVSVSGGTNKFNFAITGSNNHQENTFKNAGINDRTNLTMGFGVELAPHLTLKTGTYAIYTHNTVLDGPQNQATVGYFYGLMNTRPFVDYQAKDATGSYFAYVGNSQGVNGANPNYTTQHINGNSVRTDLIQTIDLNYQPLKFLELDAKYGIDYRRDETTITIDNQSNIPNVAADHYVSFYGTDNTGEKDNFNNTNTTQNLVTSATIRLDLDKDLGLNIPIKSSTQVAYDYRKQKDDFIGTSATGLPNYLPFTANQAVNFKTQFDGSTPFVTFGYLLNQRFDYADLMGVSGGFRTDWSSAFGAGSTPFTFPRADGYFRFSQLPMWKNAKINDVVSEFKIRSAWGKAGIQPNPFDRYVTLSTQTLGNSNAFYTGQTQPNPNLNVEVSQEFEIGSDLVFKVLKGSWLQSVSLTGTYWKRSTDNAIWPTDAAPSTGTGTLTDNSFSLSSSGVLGSVNAFMYSGKDFSWNFKANFNKQTSEITAVKGQPVVIISSAGSTNYTLTPGLKIGQLFGYLGLHSVAQADPATGQPYIASAEQAKYVVASNGWVVDKTTKQPYFTAGQYSFGDPNPTFNMAFINEFNIKNYLSFNFQFDWINGSHIYNQTKEWMYRDGISADYTKPITIDGNTGAWTAFYRGVYAFRARNGTKNYFYEDASFVRLRNVSVAFDFAQAFNIKGIRKLQLVLSGRNLLTFTKYTGFDPEISSGTNNSAWDRGTDHNTLPNSRTYQVGVNLGF